MHIVGGQREIRTCREIYDASVVAACAQLEAGLNAVGLRHHDVQDEQIEAKILVFVQKREQSSTAAEAMQAAETVGVLPFVILVRVEGIGCYHHTGQFADWSYLSYFLTCAVSGSESLYL